MVRYGGNDMDKEKDDVKFLRIIPKKYMQIAISIETLLDLPALTIEEVGGGLRRSTNRNEPPPGGPVTIAGKLLFTEEQWLIHQK